MEETPIKPKPIVETLRRCISSYKGCTNFDPKVIDGKDGKICNSTCGLPDRCGFLNISKEKKHGISKKN